MPSLPDTKLRSPGAVPPTLFRFATLLSSTPVPPFGRRDRPSAVSPTMLPTTTLSLELLISIPSLSPPEIRLPSPGPTPPMTLAPP
jgi:hypothetical protein